MVSDKREGLGGLWDGWCWRISDVAVEAEEGHDEVQHNSTENGENKKELMMKRFHEGMEEKERGYRLQLHKKKKKKRFCLFVSVEKKLRDRRRRRRRRFQACSSGSCNVVRIPDSTIIPPSWTFSSARFLNYQTPLRNFVFLKHFYYFFNHQRFDFLFLFFSLFWLKLGLSWIRYRVLVLWIKKILSRGEFYFITSWLNLC